MKRLALILSLLLPLFGVSKWSYVQTAEDPSRFSITESPSSKTTTDNGLNRDFCITAAQGYTFAGNQNSNSVSFHTAKSGRRSSQQTRSSSRIVKCGKVIDNNHIHPFLSQPILPLGGIHISERYLFALCRLRL